MLNQMQAGEAHQTRRIAVIGGGIAGLSAAWLLSHNQDVTLYEAETRPGGHSHTVDAPTPSGPVAVDTGFIVYNERNYPNLVALFDHLGVATQNSQMSFAASLDGGALEYSSRGLNGLIGQRGNVARGRFWRMVSDIVRFYAEAPRLLDRAELEDVTLGQYLDAHDYSDAFIEDHLLPMGAAIWSTTAKQMRDYPLKAFVRFFASHGLLKLIKPRWRTVSGGSRHYVEALAQRFASGMRLGTPVAKVARAGGMVTITDTAGHQDVFTDVVIATHADQTLAMLADADQEERHLLGAVSYTDNVAVLHSDPGLMPRRRRVWSSWNYIGESEVDGHRPLCVTYWMNLLQSLDAANPLFVTLNPTHEVGEGMEIGRYYYRHPLFDAAAISAQQQFWTLQGRRNTWYCGSYFGHGFHEDALQSGLAAAEAVGGTRRPWTVAGESNRITLAPAMMVAE